MRGKALITLLVCLFMALPMAACGQDGQTGSSAAPTGTPAPTPMDLGQTGTAGGDVLNSFSLRLLRQIDDGQQNVMICPLSVGVSLGMLRVGAAGETAAQLDTVLGFTGLDNAGLLSLFQRLYGDLQSVNGLDLSLIHGIYVGEGPTVTEKYVQNITEYFDAPVDLIDFSDAVTLEIINDWVGQVTGGRVDRLFESLSADLNVLLVDNAIFSGQWQRSFNERATAPLPFDIDDGHPVVVSVMFGQVEMARYTDDDADCAYIPLSGGDAEMWVILPPEGVVLTDFVDSLTLEQLADWRSEAEDGVWKVKLPRIDLTWSGDLDSALMAMGAVDIVDAETADLSVMGAGLHLSQATHRTQFALDETGQTENEIISPALSLQSSQNDQSIFTATRPFVFMVTDRDSGAILFAGTLHNPLLDHGT